MIGAVILLLLYWAITPSLLPTDTNKLKVDDRKFLLNLFWVHYFFTICYFLYVQGNRSDSYGYFLRSSTFKGNWFSLYTTGTKFIDFVAFPLTNWLNFSYEMAMVTFSYCGYWGFVFFYRFFTDNLQFKHQFYGYSLLGIIFCLPNMHFWTSSLGKGSLIFLGLGLSTFGLSDVRKNLAQLIVGMILVYHIRSHVFLFMVVGIAAGYFLGGSKKIPAWQKYGVVVIVLGISAVLYKTILAKIGLDSDNVVSSFNTMADKRAAELSRFAGSGIDISNYSIPMKLFTFWYRPLFVDAPNPLGLVISVENLFYVLLTIKLFHPVFIGWVRTSSSSVKACIFIFLLSSFALSTTMSNLGIIQRQKSMVMYFLFFVILSFLDYLKLQQYQKQQITLARRKRNMEMYKAVGS